MESTELSLDTSGRQVLDLTSEVVSFCRSLGDGLLSVFVPHATAGAWFQLYCDPDPEVTAARVRRAEASGCSALVVTVDAPVWGVRYRGLGDSAAFAAAAGSTAVSSGAATFLGLDWTAVERLAATTALPVVLKGILHPADAARAAEIGVAEVVEAVTGRLEVYVDGGVRSGADVLRALALGARAVLVGRPYLWALTLGGDAGVLALLRRLSLETANAMTLAGQTDATRVERGIVVAGGAPLS